jgi:hypothetical protein
MRRRVERLRVMRLPPFLGEAGLGALVRGLFTVLFGLGERGRLGILLKRNISW